MKKLIMITGSILFICILISFYRQSYGAGAQAQHALYSADAAQEQESLMHSPHSSMQTDQNSADDSFTVKAYLGKIAVFKGNEQQPCFVSEVHISTLPRAGRSLLENGIAVPDKKSLDRLLQDYLS